MSRHVPYIPQMEVADCGAACLAMVLAYHGKVLPLEDVRDATGTGRDGVDALRLVEAARWFGLLARGVRADLSDLSQLPPASILHWGFNHFVVFESCHHDAVDVVDPAGGRRRVPSAEVRHSYTGVAITFQPGETFQREVSPTKGTWRYLRLVFGQARVLRRILVTSLLLRLFALALPLLTAAVIDRALPAGDAQLLAVVSIAGLVMAVYYFLVAFVRAHLLLELRAELETRLTLGFVSHLVELPYAFFLKRSAGDLMARLRSNSTVREFLTTGAISSLLDGVMACLYIGLMLALNRGLGLVAIALGALQVAVLALSSKRTQQLMAESLEAEARSGSYAYQLLAGIEALKAAGGEHRAVEHWSNLFAGELNAGLARGRLTAAIDSVMSGAHLASPLIILAIGAWQVLERQLSLGTMLALSALAAGFLEPLSLLVATALQVQLLGSYMLRINDVLDTPREQQGLELRPAGQLSGHVRAEDVSFRYSRTAPLVVQSASLEIRPGQKVAIVGRSGSGKSTLAHLLLGLYPPMSGRVLYDEVDLAEIEARSVRRQMGIVTQNAYLFGSTIRENIALADPSLPLEAVVRAGRLACIDDDISAMPLEYETTLADGGASLSGGQRQRIALARALAHEPGILLLDEATSALDAVTERQVYRNLETLHCTTIVIAHRLSTIVDADLILVLDDGRLVERGRHKELMAQRGRYYELVLNQAPGAAATVSSQLS